MMSMSNDNHLVVSFTTYVDDASGRLKRMMTFHVVEKDIDRNTRHWVILTSTSKPIKCVSITFDPKPESSDDAVVINDIRYDTKCADEGLPRKYGTRAMLLGVLNVLRDVSSVSYPHLRRIELDDEAMFTCPSSPSTRDDGKVATFATDLLLQRETYYERHLKVRPQRKAWADILDRVKKRVDRPIDASFTELWSTLSADEDESTPRIRWLHANQGFIRDRFHASQPSWREFFRDLHRAYNCAFFACCWRQLCVFFDMTRLIGAGWFVPMSELPSKSYKISGYRVQKGGDGDSGSDGSGGEGCSSQTRKCECKCKWQTMKDVAEREVQRFLDDKFFPVRHRRWSINSYTDLS